MPKKFGTGMLIRADELQEDDLYTENTRSKLRLEVKMYDIVEASGQILIQTGNGPRHYEFDRPVILIQRDGLPVPNPDDVG